MIDKLGQSAEFLRRNSGLCLYRWGHQRATEAKLGRLFQAQGRMRHRPNFAGKGDFAKQDSIRR